MHTIEANLKTLKLQNRSTNTTYLEYVICSKTLTAHNFSEYSELLFRHSSKSQELIPTGSNAIILSEKMG
jgi:hypothetical protein